MEQSNTKLSYLALVLSAGALAVCAATAGLSALPNNSNISKLQQQVDALTKSNTELTAELESGIDNRHRIDELDVGLTAITQVANIDPEKLARAIGAIKAADAKRAISTPLPGESESHQADVAVAPTAPQQVPAPTAKPQPAPGPATASPKEESQQVEQAIAASSESTSYNPFAPSAEKAVSEEIAAPLSVASEKTAPAPALSIAQVDGILAKRISEKWYKPANAKDNLSAVIQIKMSRDGKVASTKIVKASGDEAYDTSVINAVNSIMAIKEVAQLSEADYKKAYASRSIQFTPQMGG